MSHASSAPRSSFPPSRWIVTGLVLTAVAACSSDDGPVDPPPPAQVASVEVTPQSVAVNALGEMVEFSAVARDADGSTLPDVPITWSSSDDAVATVDGNGVATAQGNGTAMIVATAEGESGSGELVVEQEVTGVSVEPDVASLAEGDVLEFSAAAVDANGNPVTGAEVVWSSTDPEVVTVDETGLAEAVGRGEARVLAEVDEFVGEAQVTVRARAAAVAVSPESATFGSLGDTSQFEASATDADGEPIEGVIFTWSSSDSEVVTVDETGLAEAVANGEATIRAEVDDEAGTAAVTVAQGVASVQVSPDSASVEEGDTIRFQASAEDANGNEVAGAEIEWSSSDEAVATVDQEGLATAVGEGTAEITAASTGVEGSAVLVVEAVADGVGSISQLLGDDQNGMTTREFSDSLIVVVEQNGGPVEGVTVQWEVTEGAVTLSDASTVTDAEGRAGILVTSDTLLVDHGITASVDSPFTDAVSFSLRTTVAWFRMGDDFFEDWQGRQNSSFEAQVAVGDTVMWEYVSGNTSHTVTSGQGTGGDAGSGVPDGGTPMDSPSMQPGDTFRTVLDTAGNWTYFCQVHPAFMFDATLVAVEPDEG